MTQSELPRILVVDDEEAILETMTYTFMDTYEVLSATDGERALEILDEKAPVSVILSDQRMPSMSGVELLAKAFEKHPETVRIMLTGFADADATIQAINDGHIYAYINKPWEPSELKQVVARAIQHHQLAKENTRLVGDLQRVNHFLTAMMDRLEVGAIAVDVDGRVQAVNRPVREYLKLPESCWGDGLGDILCKGGLDNLAKVTEGLAEAEGGSFEELTLEIGGARRRLRVSAQSLVDPDGTPLGRVLLFKEISHEPLRRRFEEIVAALSQRAGDLRPAIQETLDGLAKLSGTLGASDVSSAHMYELTQRVSRTQTALQSWLDVDERLAAEDYPDVQLLRDRLQVALKRWPYPDDLPERVRALGEAVESYYETGDNPKRRIL